MLSLKFGRVFVREKKRILLSLGGFALFIDPYDHYFYIKLHHFISNQRILIGLIIMINPYKHKLAFWHWFLGFRPMSVLQSHLPLLYLHFRVQICLEIMTSTCGLSMTISTEQMTCLSRSGRPFLGLLALDLVALRSSSDLSLCGLTDTQSAYHVIIYFLGLPQVIYHTTDGPFAILMILFHVNWVLGFSCEFFFFVFFFFKQKYNGNKIYN